MATSSTPDGVPTSRRKRRGAKEGKLCVIPFLLEEKDITRINKNMCTEKEIERLMNEGYGPPPKKYLNSNGKVEFPLKMSGEEFKVKLIEIYPKLADHPFFLLKANKSNDLEHLDIRPSCYKPNDIYDSNLGQGKLYIRIGYIEDFQERAPRPNKRRKHPQPVNTTSLLHYRPIQPKPSTSTPISVPNVAPSSSTSTINFLPSIISLPGSTLNGVPTNQTMRTNDPLVLPKTMSNQMCPPIGLGEQTDAVVSVSSSNNLTSEGSMFLQNSRNLVQSTQQNQQQLHEHHVPSFEQEQTLQRQQFQQQSTASSLSYGQTPQRFSHGPVINMAIPPSFIPSSVTSFPPSNNSTVTSELSGQVLRIPSELLIPESPRVTNAAVSSFPGSGSYGQCREDPSSLDILADRAINEMYHESGREAWTSNQVQQIDATTEELIPNAEIFDADAFIQDCKETGSLTVSQLVIQNKDVLARVHQEKITIHSLTIEPPCQPKEVYEMFPPPPTLQFLSIKGNVFDDIDNKSVLTNFTLLDNLVELDFSDTTIIGDMYHTFLSTLVWLKDLKGLCLNNNNLGIVGAEALALPLTSLCNLEVLKLSKNHLTDDGVGMISEKIAKLKNLKVLELSSNSITSAGVSSLFKHISTITNLQKLDLSSNLIGDDFLENVATDEFKFLASLRELLLNSNKMTWLGVSRLCSILHTCKSLQIFNLGSNQVALSLISLAGTGKSLKHLKSLNLANTGIHGEAMDGLRALLENLKDLKVLVLSGNYIRGGGAGLGSLKYFKKLNVSCNTIGDAGVKTLTDVLPSLHLLEELILDSNHIGNDGVETLCSGLGSLKSLKKLNVSCNNIGATGAKALANVLPSLHLLEELNLSGNYISNELCSALGSLKYLKKLNVSSIRDISATALGNMLPSLHLLEELDLSHNYIGDDGVETLCSGLGSLKSLKKLDISCNDIHYTGTKALANVLSSLHLLEKLDLSRNYIGDDDVETLCSGLSSLKFLKKLDVSFNNIGDAGAKALANVLPSLHLLEELDLYFGCIGDDGFETLCSGLRSLKHLKELNVSHNKIGDTGAKALANVLPSLHLLEELNLMDNRIGDDGVETLCFGLGSLKFLKKLDVSWNDIGDTGAKALADVLASLHLLEELILSSERIVNDGVGTLCSGLSSLKYLKKLDVFLNIRDSAGALALANVLSSLHLLEELNLTGNCIGGDGVETLCSLKFLKELNVSYNNIGATGAKALANVLPSLHLLEELNLMDNRIGDDGVETLCFGLGSLKFLKKLDVSSNNIGATGAKALANVLPSLHLLEELNLRDNRIGDDGVETLCFGLGSLKFLKNLDVASNDIGATGAKALANVLPSLHLLKELYLKNNRISNDGVKELRSRSDSLKITNWFVS